MSTKKTIFDTVHFMITLGLVGMIIFLFIAVGDAQEGVDSIEDLYGSLRTILGSPSITR
jgi:hypothetical protein